MDRPISPNEVVNWLLDHALVDVTAYRLHAVEEWRVIGGCACECTSISQASESQLARDGPVWPVPRMASKCFMRLVRPLCGVWPLWQPLRASCRPDARPCRQRTIQTSGASQPSVRTDHDVPLSLAKAPSLWQRQNC